MHVEVPVPCLGRVRANPGFPSTRQYRDCRVVHKESVHKWRSAIGGACVNPVEVMKVRMQVQGGATGQRASPPDKPPPGFRVNWSELDDYGLVIEGWLPLPTRASSPGMDTVPLWGVGCNPSSVNSYELQNTPEGKTSAAREKCAGTFRRRPKARQFLPFGTD